VLTVCAAECQSLESDQCANSLCSSSVLAKVPVLATQFHAVFLFDLFSNLKIKATCLPKHQLIFNVWQGAMFQKIYIYI
jgi:hypothetical protein